MLSQSPFGFWGDWNDWIWAILGGIYLRHNRLSAFGVIGTGMCYVIGEGP